MGNYETIISENCKIFTDIIDVNSLGIINALVNSTIGKGAKIRIMPDVHAGTGCIIGTSMDTKDKVSPILLGGDIGCGVTGIRLHGKPRINLEKLDKFIDFEIPNGMRVYDKALRNLAMDDNMLDFLNCNAFNKDKALRSIGTLGGGNHFIELGIETTIEGKDFYWLIVHSGSRHLGAEIAEYYKTKAKEQHPEEPYAFAYLDDKLAEDFVEDVDILEEFAHINRLTILRRICDEMKWKYDIFDGLNSCHNYIRLIIDNTGKRYRMRKGCISAAKGMRSIIPINMRDGSLIVTGKANGDWNDSAPHGAGRLMSREEARNSITLSEFKKSMKGIYTTSIMKSTIDESPMVYKSVEYLTARIGDTVRIDGIIRPIYNFKADGETK